MSVLVALESRLPADLSDVDRWLHTGPDAAWRFRAESGPLSGIPRIDRADRLQERAWELRAPFLEWSAELSLRHDDVAWWSSQLGSRTPYSGFFERVCLLAVALETLAEETSGTTLVVCATPALAAAVADAAGVERPPPSPTPHATGSRPLRVWARLAPTAMLPLPGRSSDGARRTLDSDPRYRRRVLERRGLLRRETFGGPNTALLFTWIDDRSFDANGGYRDPHLGRLGELLRERGVEVAFVPRVLGATSFDEAAERLSATGERFVFPDAFLEISDHRACAARAAGFALDVPPDAAVAGVPVANLARELVAGEPSVRAAALTLDALVQRFADGGIRPERVVHTCEGHPWELVLAHAVHRHLPGTSVIGYDNLNMSRLSLSMFFAPPELAVRPLPDRIVTNGRAFHDVLLSEGMPASAVRVGCGLRHERLWELEAPLRRRGVAAPLRIVAAGEIAPGPSVELIRKAADAFALDPAFDLVVKPHPLLPQSALERLLGPRAAGLRFVDKPMTELLQSADALLYAFSAVGFEALALGVPPVFVRSDSALDLDKLEFAADLRWQARTVEELRASVRQIAELRDEELERWRVAARRAAESALGPCRTACVDAFL